jgi:ankyrin repeat protein
MAGCPRYDIGFENLHSRDEHMKLHNRPFECPTDGCFYNDIVFANGYCMNQHLSLCHSDPVSSGFIFPKSSKLNLTTPEERSMLHEAIYYGNLNKVQHLIRTNSSLRDCIVHGKTPLQDAATRGQVAIAEFLLRSGADIGAKTKYGTALNVACVYVKVDMVQLLLSHSRCGEDMYSRDSRGNTPLLSAVSRRRGGGGVVRLLLEDGRVDVHTRNYVGMTALSMAAYSRNMELVEMLLKLDKVDVNATDNGGHISLYWAVLMNDEKMVRLLLAHDGVDVNATGDGGFGGNCMTPLLVAQAKGYQGLARLLGDHIGA